MHSSDEDIRQARIEAAFLTMHREAARGMHLFPADRHCKPYFPLGLRRLRAKRYLLKARKPYLRLHARIATLQQIEEAYDRRHRSMERRHGDAEWFTDRWLYGIQRVAKNIPYTSTFSSEFPNVIQSQDLWRLTVWLQQYCQSWPQGPCDAHDYQYLIELLTDPIVQSTAAQPERLNKAVQWLEGQLLKLARSKGRRAAMSLAIDDSVLRKADAVAEKIGLIEDGSYALGPRKKSALVGFHQALKQVKLLQGTISELNTFFGKRYNVDVLIETFTDSKVGIKYNKLAYKALKKDG